MKLYKALAAFSVLAGIAGGMIRYMQLKTGFEADTGLPIANNPYCTALMVISLVIIILFAFFSYFMHVPESRCTPALFIKQSAVSAIFYYASLLLLAVAGVLQLMIALSESALGNSIAALLMLFSSISMLIIGKMMQQGDLKSENGIFVLTPVFWSSFWLIINFRTAAANPVIEAYIYDIFSFIALVLTLFNFAAVLFDRKSVRKLYFSATMCMYFSMVSFIGEAMNLKSITTQMGESVVINSDLVYLAIFLAAICFSAFCILRIFRNKKSLSAAKQCISDAKASA